MQEEKISEEQILQENTNRKGSLGRDVLQMVFYLAGVVIVVAFLYHFVGQQVEVKGESMEQTLSDGDRLILEKITYRFDEPERYDMIVFHPEQEKKDVYYIKRIIGLPGETVQIKNGFIYINGEKIKEDYGKEEILEAGLAKQEQKLGEHEYFVLGDNRNNSRDSRSSKVGNVERESIVGRVLVKIWPINEIEKLKHQ